jgi:membrane-associated PAP2 superfamily phosphatase
LLLSHLLLPLVVLAGVVLVLETSAGDLRVADWIYRASGGAWTWRDAWLTRNLIHEGGRALVAAALLALLVLLAASHVVHRLRPFRHALWYLLASALAAALTVNVLKQLTRIDCPWDLQRYGGAFEYVGIFTPHPGTFRYGACFPSGHASGAYAWLGLYYVARDYRPQWRWRALSGVVALGLLFGVGQQLRGAHFLSHDLWSLAVCWCIATLLYVVFFASVCSPSNARDFPARSSST